MTEMAEPSELLFFDTFSHESSEELNLDLVQFPKPVYITEVRIIPLGARVQADFPGGVRLGATNPSQFSIEFFVNDLGKPGASTFESLGGFEYNQNGCIHLECTNNEVNSRQIPTDGLVLRGWYTTITLAVYGTLTKNLAEQVLPPVVAQPAINQQPPPLVTDVQQIVPTQPLEGNWPQDVNINPVQIEYNQPQQPVSYSSSYVQPETYTQEYHHVEYYNTEPPKDPRYHHTHTPETEWEQKDHSRRNDRVREPDHCREPDPRDPDRHYSRSHSRDRDRRDYREPSRDRDREWERERAPSMDPRDRDWDRGYKLQDSYKRSRDTYGRGISADREEVRKRPRTPPMMSPKRPHTPHGEKELSPGDVESISEDEIAAGTNDKIDKDIKHSDKLGDPLNKKKEHDLQENEEPPPMDVEEFEPILSDEDICDEGDTFQDMEYDLSAYSNNDDIIKLFNPISTTLQKYRSSSYINVRHMIEINEALETVTNKINKYFSKLNDQMNNLIDLLNPCANKYNFQDFKSFSPEIKEEFVHICEQLPAFINNNQQYQTFIELFLLIAENKIKTTFGSYFDQLKILQQTLVSFVNVGLNFDLALTQNQPCYKIRHIKCGVRLAEACCSSRDFVTLMLKNNEDLHMNILSLFDKEYMALSIKLLILKALDASLNNKNSIEQFLSKKTSENGYQMLVKMLKNASSVRIKFALNSLITKLNVYELLKKFKATTFAWCKTTEDIKQDDLKFVLQGLEQILKMYQRGSFEMSQPRRFLPVSTQFEINRSEERNVIYNFFATHQLLECLLILLTHPKTVRYSTIMTYIHEFINQLLKNYDGIVYMSENLECVNLIMKCFLQQEDTEASYVLSEAIYVKSQSLGLNMAYKLQCFYYVELLLDLAPKHKYNCDSDDILDALHSFFSLTYVNIGKVASSEVLSLHDNIKCLLEFLQIYMREDDLKDDFTSKLRKSPGVGYIVDLLAITVINSNNVPFLEKYGKQILHIAHQHDKFEASSAARLKDLTAYLKPLEIPNVFSYDDIKPLCEILKQSIENITNFPPQLITSLRILRFLGISDNNNQSAILSENSNYNLIELKYKHVILQLFSLDGVANLSAILQKICEYYEQPSLHLSTFSSTQGSLVMDIVLPAVQLLHQMLMHVIQCRNTEFKDLTSIPVLLQTYNLAYSFPVSSIAAFKAREVCQQVIDTLLVYSQPVSEEVSENDSLNKTLWTLMSGEVIKYITLAPYTFIPGLLVFSELLPLPLPIQTHEPLQEDEVKRVVNLRKLWSAHLHSHSTSIQEFINRLCTSVHQPLLHLLRRVCIQMSDLAANSALMISRGVLDSVITSLTPKSEKPQAIICSSHSARLLHFLACLATHSAIKCAVLQLLGNSSNLLKIDEKYPPLVSMFCQILKTKNESPSHIQGQECIINIIQNLCDAEITLVQNIEGVKSDISSEVYLSNSLPTKDLLLPFITTLVDHFVGDNPFATILPCVRTFLLLTEHDYGFYHLCLCLEKKGTPFLVACKKFVSGFSKESPEMLQTLNTVLEFVRVCTTTEVLEGEGSLMFTPRTAKISIKELRLWFGWKQEEGSEEKHPLYTLENLLKSSATDLEPLQLILDSVSSMLQRLNSVEGDATSERTEIVLPPSDTLLNQFACRPVYNLVDLSEERLTTTYWLSSPQDEGDSESELVPCDIMEIWRQHLPADVNLNREIERIIRICSSQDANDRNSIDQVKNKRNMDEQKGDKMKKPYVTPMRGRGFPRVAPQRGDLFRSRPPNTSRPPSLHVDDFVALETCGAQPTGPTGYNKLSRDILSTRVRSIRGRTFISPDRGMHFRPI